MGRRNHDVIVGPKGGGRSGYTVKQDGRVISQHNKQSTAIDAGKHEAEGWRRSHHPGARRPDSLEGFLRQRSAAAARYGALSRVALR